MAKIKFFEGSGPNPNVPFANLPDSRFFGQTEDAVAKVTGEFTKQAVQYAEYQAKQTDASSIAAVESEKSQYLTSLRANSINPDGTYNVEAIQKGLEKFDGEAQKRLSKRASDFYTQKQTERNGFNLNSLANENLKITRELNVAKTDEAVGQILSNSVGLSLQEKQIAYLDASELLQEAIATGIKTPQEAKKTLDDAKFGYSKGFLKNLLDADNEASFEEARAFVELDPYQYYSSNQLAKNDAINSINAKHDRFLENREKDQKRKLDLQSANRNKIHKSTYLGLTSRLQKSLDTTGEGGLGGDNFQQTYEEVIAEAKQALGEDRISLGGYNKVLTFSKELAGVEQTIKLGKMYANPDKSAEVFATMTDTEKEKYTKDFAKIQNAPTAFKEARAVFKDATKSLINWGSGVIIDKQRMIALESKFLDNFTKAKAQSKSTSDTMIILKTVKDVMPLEKYNMVFNSFSQQFYIKYKEAKPQATQEEAVRIFKNMLDAASANIDSVKLNEGNQ